MLSGLFAILAILFNIAVTVFLLIMAYRAVQALEASARAQRGTANALQQIAKNFPKSNEEN